MCDFPLPPTASAVPCSVSMEVKATASFAVFVDATGSPAFHVPVASTGNVHLREVIATSRGAGGFGTCAAVVTARSIPAAKTAAPRALDCIVLRAWRAGAAARPRRVLQRAVLIERGIHLELDAHLADLGRRLRRIAGNAGICRPSPRLDLILANPRRPHVQHL